jgi:hypothetical protein
MTDAVLHAERSIESDIRVGRRADQSLFCYLFGRGVPQSDREAVRLFKPTERVIRRIKDFVESKEGGPTTRAKRCGRRSRMVSPT